MLDRLQTVIGQVVESVLAIVGVRAGTEEPGYTATPLTGGVEIRRYGPRIAAETIVDDDEEAARSEGFRRLARYIFGANHRRERVAMTAPVAQQPGGNGSARIAMTAPVAQSAARKPVGGSGSTCRRSGRWRISPPPTTTGSVWSRYPPSRSPCCGSAATAVRAPSPRAPSGWRMSCAPPVSRPPNADGVVLRSAVDAAVPAQERGRGPDRRGLIRLRTSGSRSRGRARTRATWPVPCTARRG